MNFTASEKAEILKLATKISDKGMGKGNLYKNHKE